MLDKFLLILDSFLVEIFDFFMGWGLWFCCGKYARKLYLLGGEVDDNEETDVKIQFMEYCGRNGFATDQEKYEKLLELRRLK